MQCTLLLNLQQSWGTHPTPGRISKTKAIRLSKPPQSGGSTGAGQPLLELQLSFLHAWLEKEKENHLSTQAMSTGTKPSSLSQPFLEPQELGNTSGSAGSEELPQQPEVAEAKPHSLSQAAAKDRWHQKLCPELTQSKLPAAGQACTPAELLLSSAYRNPSAVLLLLFHLAKLHAPHASKPRDNSGFGMQPISTNANQPFTRGSLQGCLLSTSSGAAGAAAGDASCCGK